MKTHFNILQEALLTKLDAELSGFGFRLNLAKRVFRSRRHFGSVTITLNTIKHGNIDFDVTGNVGLRIDAVEEVVNKYNTMATDADKASTVTIGSEFGNIINGCQKRWTVKDDGDIDGVSNEFLQNVKMIAIPYIDKYSNLRNTLEVLSGNTPSSWLHSPSHGDRCRRALALAYILQDSQKIKFLIEANTIFLKSRNDYSLRSFELLVKELTSSKGVGPE